MASAIPVCVGHKFLPFATFSKRRSAAQIIATADDHAKIAALTVSPDYAMRYSYRRLAVSDVGLLKELLRVFGEAFREFDTYQTAVPSDAYLRTLLSRPHFIASIAMHDERKVVGGLVAYELEKFEQDRREIYIYDLAVLESHRRKGIATRLIEELKHLAKESDAYVIFVQADKTDSGAIRLYESIGTKEDVYHFDIMVDSNPRR